MWFVLVVRDRCLEDPSCLVLDVLASKNSAPEDSLEDSCLAPSFLPQKHFGVVPLFPFSPQSPKKFGPPLYYLFTKPSLALSKAAQTRGQQHKVCCRRCEPQFRRFTYRPNPNSRQLMKINGKGEIFICAMVYQFVLWFMGKNKCKLNNCNCRIVA